MEPITTSLATNPVIRAAEACQSSKPAGAKTGDTASASTPYAESCTSSTSPKPPAFAVAGMPCSSHSATIIEMMITLAPRMNCHRRTTTERTSCTARGHWYGGKASISGSGVSPRNMVCRNSTPTSRMSNTEATYMRNTTRPACCGKNAWASTRNTVRRAEHEANGMSMPVSTRWRESGRVRVAANAGRLQPKPTTIGRNARPSNPNARIARSITNAARAR